jgi:hypothetical protein
MSRAYLDGIDLEERSILRSPRHRLKTSGIPRRSQGKEGNVPWKLPVIRMEGVGRSETHTIPFYISQWIFSYTQRGYQGPAIGAASQNLRNQHFYDRTGY